MALPRLVLNSSRGDQTLNQVKYVLYGATNGTEFEAVSQNGLRFTEGRPMVSTNLVQPGRVLICVAPAGFHIGYGVFTTAYIDRAAKQVVGAPLRFASARNQLAFYMSPDTEASRSYIESEVERGLPIEQRMQFNLDAQHIVGSFDGGSGYQALVDQLDVSIRALEFVDFERMVTALREVFRTRTEVNTVQVPEVIRMAIVGTVESIIISKLRIMRWQGLSLLGYRFIEDGGEIVIAPVASADEQRRRMDELGRKLASSRLFEAELSWLKTYVFRELELMRVELDGAELEAQPD